MARTPGFHPGSGSSILPGTTMTKIQRLRNWRVQISEQLAWRKLHKINYQDIIYQMQQISVMINNYKYTVKEYNN